MKIVHGSISNERKEIRVLGDSGCDAPVIAEAAANILNLPLYDQKITRIITAGNQVMTSNRRVMIRLENWEDPSKFIQFVAIVVPGVDGWPSRVPASRPPWLADVSHILADPLIADDKVTHLSYSILLNRACLNLLDVTMAWRNESGFSMQSSTVGLIPSGTWIPGSSIAVPMFLREKMNSLNSYFNEILANPEEENDEFFREFKDNPNSISCLVNSSKDELSDELTRIIREKAIKSAWELFGPESDTVDLKNSETFDQFLTLVTRGEDGRVIVPLPKKAGTFPHLVSENMRTGARRIKRVEKLLNKNDMYAEAYRGLIELWVMSGILKLTSLEELRAHGPWTELPHHAVIRNSSTTSLRPVFEGNAHDPGKKSSNDWLDQGVNVLPMINEIVTDLRMNKYFIVSDISKAFVQVQLKPDDQYLLVIRWPAEKLPNGEYRYDWYRFMHLPWGICCAPFVLNAAVRYLLRKYAELYPELTEITDLLQKNAYVDDLASTGNTIEKTVRTAKVAVDALAAGKMVLQKHRGYPPEIVQELGAEPTYDPYKILGSGFNPLNDTMTVMMDNVTEFVEENRITKRKASGIVARMYDPLGWVAPATLEGKKLRQALERNHPKADWDFLLPADETKEWHNLAKSYTILQQFELPRTLAIENETHRYYHVFCDASEIAIGAVMYSVSYENNRYKINIVTAKSKINPLPKQPKSKKKTARDLQILPSGDVEMIETKQVPLQINRMELNAALLGARLVETIKLRLEKDPVIHFWSDSQVALQWIYKGPYTGAEFVDTRIKKILKTTQARQWQHCPGIDNPADMVSRGCEPKKLLESTMWRYGPEWLPIKNSWPESPAILKLFKAQCVSHEERRIFEMLALQIKDSHGNLYNDFNWRKCVLRYAAFLRIQIKAKVTYTGIMRTRAWIKRRKEALLRRDYFNKPVAETMITINEYRRAELILLRDMQKIYSPEKYYHLKANPDDVMAGLSWSSFETATPELIVSTGRQYQMIKPTGNILEKPLIYIPYSNGAQESPKTNEIAKMLMIEAHLATGNGSVLHTLTQFRKRFWVSRGKQLAKWVRKSCPVCIKYDTKIVQAPMGKLPVFRYTGQKRFAAMGLDFVGPFKELLLTGEPVWVAVFSCPLTRAVLLRPVTTVSAPAFADILNWVIREYSLNPELIISDNAKTFKNVYMSTLYANRKYLQDKFKGIVWQFNASRAPWWGGFYERFMGVIKDKVSRCFNNERFRDFHAFNAATAYIQQVINSRPLTWLASESPDHFRIITPLMFLHPGNELEQPNPFEYGPMDPNFYSITREQLERDALYLHRVDKIMWSHFKNAYIAELRQNCDEKFKSVDQYLKEKQVVLLRPDDKFKSNSFGNRKKWRMARIEKLHKSPQDGRVRSVDLVVFDRQSSKLKSFPSQSIQNIVPFEQDLLDALEKTKNPSSRRRRVAN